MNKKLLISAICVWIGLLTILGVEHESSFLKTYFTGYELYKQSNFIEAIDTLQFALLQYDSLTPIHREKIITLHIVLGACHRQLGNYYHAIKHYDKAEILAFKFGKSRKYITQYIYYNKAIAFSYIGESKKAVLLLEKVLKETNDELFKLYIYHEMGISYYKGGDNVTAIKYFEKIINNKEIQIEHFEYTLSQCAKAYSELNLNDQAIKYFKQSLLLRQSKYPKHHFRIAIVYENMGKHYTENLNDPMGLSYLKKALNIYKKNYLTGHPYFRECYYLIANYFHQNHHLDSALYYYQKALTPTNPDYFQNPNLEDQLADQELLDLLANKARALEKKARDTLPEKYLRAAHETLQLALRAIDKLKTYYQFEESKLNLGRSERDLLEQILDIALKLYALTADETYKKMAFQYADQARYITLHGYLSDQRARALAGIPDSLLQQERSVRRQITRYRELINQEAGHPHPDSARISHWEQQLFNLAMQQEKLVQHLEEQYPRYQSMKYNNTAMTVETLQENLSANDAVLEYLLMDSVLVSFVVTQSHFEVTQKQVGDAFFIAVSRLQNELSRPVVGETVKEDYYRFIEDAHALYNILIAPHKSLINGKRLYIIPDNQLTLLSFDVLLEDNPPLNVFDYAGLPYLIRQHTINYFYSARFITGHREPKSLINKLAAFAPTYNDHSQLMALPQEEVNKLARYFNSTIYAHEQATESTFKQVVNRYDILHLSMHAMGGDEQDNGPVQLVFSQENDSLENGLLNHHEIYHLPLAAKLVTLSACNAGAGAYISGEGILSLARAFHLVDCKALVTSLWPLNAGASESIMPAFYKYLSRGHRKDVAMQQAKLGYLNQNSHYGIESHPALWSNMVVLGSAEPVTYNRYLLWGGIGVIGCLVIVIFIRRVARR